MTSLIPLYSALFPGHMQTQWWPTLGPQYVRDRHLIGSPTEGWWRFYASMNWVSACATPSHYPHLYWHSVNCSHGIKVWWENAQGFLFKNYIWKCYLQNVTHFVGALMCQNQTWNKIYKLYGILSTETKMSFWRNFHYRLKRKLLFFRQLPL